MNQLQTNNKKQKEHFDDFNLIVFGGTGDLAIRKIFPALYHRYADKQLTCTYNIIAITRRKIDRHSFDSEIINFIKQNINSDQFNEKILKDFIKKIISEKNQDFLNETGAVKNYNYNDAFLRPPLVSKCIYDFMTGSIGSKTPLRYNLNYRNFYYVTSGKINIKLIPPHSSKYLYPIKDYDNFEFRSPVNVWDVQPEYKADFDKVKVLDVTLNKGEIIYIPAYWWYSIEYEKISSVCAFKYRTFMNVLAITPDIVLSMLQGQNIKRDIAKKVETTEKDKEE